MKTKLIGRIAAFILRGSFALATPPYAAAHPPANVNHAVLSRSVPTFRTTNQTPTRAVTVLNAPLLARYNRLAGRPDATRAVVVWNDFLWLQSAGYPIYSLDDWAGSLEGGVLMVGTPSALLLDYWGEPYSRQENMINGQWTQVWTYRNPAGLTVRAVVVNDIVTQVLT